MTTQEVALQLVALCKEGKNLEAIETLYADDVVSVEPVAMGDQGRETHGKQAAIGKYHWWNSAHDVHSITVDGPFGNPERFVVLFTLDATFKATGQAMKGREAAIYTVENGKIAREEFLGAL